MDSVRYIAVILSVGIAFPLLTVGLKYCDYLVDSIEMKRKEVTEMESLKKRITAIEIELRKNQ